MILAAGLGTRLKPFTDHHPKALVMVNGQTLLQRNIDYLYQHGITEIIVNVHHFADQIIHHLQTSKFPSPLRIEISNEVDEVLETGGGLKKASWFFDDQQSFVLMNVDILTNLNLKQVIDAHRSNSAVATLAVSERSSSRCFLFDENMTLCGWRNRNTGEERITQTRAHYLDYSFSGIHVIDPAIFSFIKQEGKFSMVDVYLDLAAAHTIKGYDHTGCEVLDVGKPESVIKAEEMFK